MKQTVVDCLFKCGYILESIVSNRLVHLMLIRVAWHRDTREILLFVDKPKVRAKYDVSVASELARFVFKETKAQVSRMSR